LYKSILKHNSFGDSKITCLGKSLGVIGEWFLVLLHNGADSTLSQTTLTVQACFRRL